MLQTRRNLREEFEEYLAELRAIQSTGAAVPETSFYPALAQLLNVVGKRLRPRVRCVMNLANIGAGMPDGGFFTPEQFQQSNSGEPLPGQLPARGVIEAKPLRDDAWLTANTAQVSRYWKKYGLVLVTNYRDFLLLGKDAQGQPVKLETFRLAASESAFWKLTVDVSASGYLREPFLDFLSRVLLHAAPLEDPKDVAWFLASYAREAKVRVERATDLHALLSVRGALEEALGLKFVGPKGDHFFRSTFVQTLFYGIFSGWVLWCREPVSRGREFDWRMAEWSLKVPIIRALFEQVATPGKLEPLGLVEVLDWAAGALSRVNRDEFFTRFDEGEAVQYFYEPFLEAFDPELRKDLGVWFTPREVVRYMVARIDTVLREELKISAGLADPRVVVLDPCCGTGAYLVEVLRVIETRAAGRIHDGLAAHDLKTAAMERIFGFEILPAPFVVAHLQIGLLLHNAGITFAAEKGERAAVYLTNALTGWGVHGEKHKLPFPELEEERDASERVKKEAPILVVLGNPPYNAFAGTSPEQELGLVDPYKQGLIAEWGIRKFNLDDLYVRFFRVAERRIAEQAPGRGIVSFISNFSYLSEPSFVVMRKRFTENFDALWFDSMNGDSRQTGKVAPDGSPDPSVFSTDYNREGIRVGTAIALLVRDGQPRTAPRVKYRDFWGAGKRTALLQSLNVENFDAQYLNASPSKDNRYSFRPGNVSSAYRSWPRVIDLCAEAPSNGLMEKRGGALVDIDRVQLSNRIRSYLDSSVSWDEVQRVAPGLATNAAQFNAKAARKKALENETFDVSRVTRYSVRPFENRWAYYISTGSVWNRSRPILWQQAWKGNRFLLTRFRCSKPSEGVPFYFTPYLSDDHLLSPDAVAIPFWLRNEGDLFTQTTPNLSAEIRALVSSLNPTGSIDQAEAIWHHVLAIGFSSAYLQEYGDEIRADWPRIPLPVSWDSLQRSARLGRLVASLLDIDAPLEGVTSGDLRPELANIGVVLAVDGQAIQPDKGDLEMTAGWGGRGAAGAVMPGKGRILRRAFTKRESESFAASACTSEQLFEVFSGETLDVFLNDRTYWSNIPPAAWEFSIGGYQVIKKWLSYRERSLLNRSLSVDEAREVTSMARRLAALLLLGPELDQNYREIADSNIGNSVGSG